VAELPDITSPREIMNLFRYYGLHPLRHLGQNFLIDANIVRKIVAAAEVGPGDGVIEVGPGAGALTLTIARSGASLVVLEIDRGLVRLLNDLLQPWPTVKILEQDVLKTDWRQLITTFKDGAPIKLISNLPYNISGPFIYNLFEEGFPFNGAVLMFQKEVAHRLVAAPGDSDYGALSVISRYYTEGKILFAVSKNVFWPRPKVGSAVLKLEPRPRILNIEEEPLFWKLVRGVFQQRRKTIQNSMLRVFALPRPLLSGLLAEASIDPSSRPEELSVEQFAKLTRITYNNFNKFS